MKASASLIVLSSLLAPLSLSLGSCTDDEVLFPDGQTVGAVGPGGDDADSGANDTQGDGSDALSDGQGDGGEPVEPNGSSSAMQSDAGARPISETEGDAGGEPTQGDAGTNPQRDPEAALGNEPAEPAGSQPVLGAGGSRGDIPNQGSGGAGGAGTGATGTGGEPSSGVVSTMADIDGGESNVIGGRCWTQEQCAVPDGLCVTPDGDEFGEAQFAGGYCTTECDLAAATDPCPALDPATACLQLEPDGPGYCMLLCPRGDGVVSDKCRLRPEVSCLTVDDVSGLGLCLPSCGSDADCVTLDDAGSPVQELYCNTVTGACQADEPPVVGDECNPDPDVDEVCPGFCFGTSEDNGFCLGTCTLLAPSACGYTEPPYEADCVVPVDNSTDADGSLLAGQGDTGICLPTCDCTDQCPAESECVFVEGSAEFSGRAGWCLPPVAEGASTEDMVLSECPQ